MSWQHLWAFLWLRWRLLRNQWSRAGALNAVLMTIVAIGALVTAVPLFIGSFMLGVYVIPKATPVQLMYAWDIIILGFLFFWCVGLIAELQRSEPLVLSKFLHLPVSVTGAFLINFISSLLRLSTISFVPVILGYTLALIFTKGVLMVPVLPAAVAFLMMVTGLTYQFQGWIAALVSNPRRRRSVIVISTLLFAAILQAPSLINLYSPLGPQDRAHGSKSLVDEIAKIERAVTGDQFPVPADERRRNEEWQGGEHEADRASTQRVVKMVLLANMVLPVGWLAIGVKDAAEGQIVPLILGFLGMATIGSASLWRAYRTTLGLYSGQSSNVEGPRITEAPLPASVPVGRAGLMETRIPGMSEAVSAIALAGFRSLLRSPEAKMMLLSPAIMIPIFGSMLWRGRANIPELVRPLIALGGMALILFGVLQLMGNQFGFDRDGFRVFVLSPASRRDILLGKNLVFAPLVLGFGLIMLVIVQVLCPLGVDHFVGMFPLFGAMFLLFCIFANFMSIYTPMHIAPGALKPSNPKLSIVLVQMLMFLIVFPLTQSLILLPLGIEAILRFLGWTTRAPIYSILSLVECVVAGFVYFASLVWFGELFQAREQKILEAVTNRGA